MENRVISVEHVSSQGPNISQHYQQHFQQHYAVTGENVFGTNPFPTEVALTPHQTSIEFSQSDQNQNSNFEQIQEKNEHKKTVQTTTTTTIAQPILVSKEALSGVGSIDMASQSIALNQAQPIPIYANSIQPEYGIHVEHYPQNQASNWSNLDTYLHIFLTFYFGHFAAMLFFDGILRNLANLYSLEHKNFSPLIYILHIILSIALLAFTIWFMTICWRWWRNKSLVPENIQNFHDYRQKPLGPKDRQSEAHGYVFTAALVLIFGFFCFLILGILDLSFKCDLQHDFNLKYGKTARNNLYIADLAVFLFRLALWVVGIIATLLLSRQVMFKCCCPSKQIRIDKEKPTSVYQVRN